MKNYNTNESKFNTNETIYNININTEYCNVAYAILSQFFTENISLENQP